LTRKSRFQDVLGACSALAAAAVLTAAASAGSNQGKPAPGGTTSATIELVNLSAPGAPPSFGQQVTFKVSTTATQYPWVEVRCYQGATLVYDNWVGYFSSYMFPQVFTLGPTQLWAGDAANCTAAVVSEDGRRPKTLATLTFPVSA
jgi:hypothetical protein